MRTTETEIAYFTFDREGRRSQTAKRKIVPTSKVQPAISQLILKGYEVYGTREIARFVKCAWFLNCTNAATETEPHPILGSVAICKRCADKARQG